MVGGKLQFASRQTAEDAVVLTANDFEQGGFNYAEGVNWETIKATSASYIRSKALIFSDGTPVTVKCAVAGYAVTWYTTDADGITTGAASSQIVTGAGVSFTVPAGQYFFIRLCKDPLAAIVPADAAAARITFTGTYETKLSIIDSRVEINPATSTGTLTLRPGGTYTMTPGAKYPDSVIQNSKVSMMVHATANRLITLMAEFINTSASISASVEAAPAIPGVYRNVKNLTFSGSVTGSASVSSHGVIQATDCDNFAVSPTIFPGLATAQTANMPFIFQGCNVPNGRFYHHAQIANTYKNIDFALAQANLGKAIASGEVLASSEVEGMYRLYSTTGSVFGGLVEGYDSVKSLNMAGTASSYGTTIYKDAYLNGLFDIAGTNVFGNKVRSHPLAQVLNVQPRAVQGGLTLTAGLPPVPSTESTRVRTEKYFRINGASGMGVQNIPAGVEGRLVYLDGSGNYTGLGDWYTGSVIVPTVSLTSSYAYLLFRKTGDAAITPADLAGVTVTVYNGCKIVNTGATAVNMKGNIRVEDNATLINSSIIGTGYFGGKAVMSGAIIGGCVYMRDNASFTKTAGTLAIRNLKMTENAYAVLGNYPLNGRIHLSDNARFTPTSAGLSGGDLVMKDNAVISGAVAVDGAITMKDNAKVTAGKLSAYGDITLCGSYNQTVNKTWTGKRVIDNENAPEYDNNVESQYDF